MQPNLNTPEHSNPDVKPVTDLCATCVHAENCHLRQMPTTPVHECSEYDDGAPVELEDASTLVSVSEAPRPDVPQSNVIPGLCMNCDHRETCTLPRPVGGVWHCEEYQ